MLYLLHQKGQGVVYRMTLFYSRLKVTLIHIKDARKKLWFYKTPIIVSRISNLSEYWQQNLCWNRPLHDLSSCMICEWSPWANTGTCHTLRIHFTQEGSSWPMTDWLLPEQPCRGISEQHTRPEVVAPLTAAVHLIHSDASQAPSLVSLLQLGHEHFALCNLLWGDINELQLGIPLQHFCVHPLHVFLFKRTRQQGVTNWDNTLECLVLGLLGGDEQLITCN